MLQSSCERSPSILLLAWSAYPDLHVLQSSRMWLQRKFM